MYGTGEPCRLLLAHYGASFEDHRIKSDNWENMKQKFDGNELPILELEDG